MDTDEKSENGWKGRLFLTVPYVLYVQIEMVSTSRA
jgi:hypothetical protein